MAKPTPEELSVINTKFAKKELSEDDVYVFSDLMIDNRPTSYYSRIHENLLKTFLNDTRNGIGLLMNHNSRTLPVGRSFDAELKHDDVDGSTTPTLYGKYYMPLGVATQQGMSTDDLAKSIDAGTVFDTSIGFSAEQWCCSICKYDIRDWRNCMHFPGEKYMVENANGVNEETMCYVDVGEDGEGSILENSLVYAGAAGRATIVKQFAETPTEQETAKNDSAMSKLSVVDNIKTVPATAKLFQYLSADGVVLLTDTTDRTDITKLRSELQVNEKVTELEGKLSATEAELTNVQGQLSAKEGELATATATLSEKESEITYLTAKVAELEGKEQELSAKVTELTAKAEVADQFRADLIEQTLDAGVKAQGNSFMRDKFAKFLSTLSIEEIKEAKTGFEQSFSATFANAKRVTEAGNLEQKPDANAPLTRSSFETEQEFRDYVGKTAITYAKEHGIGVAEATEKLFAELNKEVK